MLLTKPSSLEEKIEDMEFQFYRLQDNLKKIAKQWKVLGFEEYQDNKWVVVSVVDDANVCKIMLNTCEQSFLGHWDFTIQAQYLNDYTIHIGDIIGEPNKGFGSICMRYLKEYASSKNIQIIEGDIAKRDWGHLDRLTHFYKKHRFQIELDNENKQGKIICNPHL
ncbi:hypothetical protein BTS2_1411 [Bacillus sp. TS-2]|nr:hypothetical protein BTS2_1411 [Bacillus sp. TS-2]